MRFVKYLVVKKYCYALTMEKEDTFVVGRCSMRFDKYVVVKIIVTSSPWRRKIRRCGSVFNEI